MVDIRFSNQSEFLFYFYDPILPKSSTFAPNKNCFMKILEFLSGTGLFFLLAIVLIGIYFYNRRKNK